MKIEDLRPIIDEKAIQVNIDADLVEAFCRVESSLDPLATRYEPAFYKRYIQPLVNTLALTPKEAIGRATSWGLMQLMGQVAREKGFQGDFTELLIPETGLTWALKHLRYYMTKYPNQDDAIAAYNAGSPRNNADGKYVNQGYVDKIHKSLGEIKGGYV